MYEYYDNYLAAKGDVDTQARWIRQLTWEVARHAAGEEIVVYPLMEKHLGSEGRQLADRDRADHQVRSVGSLVAPRAIQQIPYRSSKTSFTDSRVSLLVPMSMTSP